MVLSPLLPVGTIYFPAFCLSKLSDIRHTLVNTPATFLPLFCLKSDASTASFMGRMLSVQAFQEEVQ